MNQPLPITYRAPTPNDLHFVLSSWLLGGRNTDLGNYISNPDYYFYYQNVVKSILKRSVVSIIANPADLDQIYGYIVCETKQLPNIDSNSAESTAFIVHYLYIKPLYRNLGMARNLLSAVNPAFGISTTYLSNVDRVDTYAILDRISGKPIVKRSSAFLRGRKKYLLAYNPFLMVGETT